MMNQQSALAARTGSTFDRVLAGVDDIRRACFATCLRHRSLAALLVRRERRIATIVTAYAGLAFVVALWMPVVALVLGPLLLGVPHVVADLRYLVLRRRLAPRWQVVALVGCVALLGERLAVELTGKHQILSAEPLLVAVWLVLAITVAIREGGGHFRAAVVALLGGAAVAATLRWPLRAQIVLLHGHNLVALVAWGILSRGRLRARLLPLIAIGLAGAVLVSGLFWQVSVTAPGAQLFGLHLLAAADWIAPGLATPAAIGATTCFAFLQAVHYLVWLVVIPQEETAAAGTPTFRMSARGWRRDLGAAGIVGIALAAFTVIAFGCVQPLHTRAVYLSLSMFHSYLELVMLSYFWIRGSRRA